MSNQILLRESPGEETLSSIYNKSEYSLSAGASLPQSRILEAMKTQYRLDQQAKFLSLQAETESLLRQLQAVKQQRESVELSGVGETVGGDRVAP